MRVRGKGESAVVAAAAGAAEAPKQRARERGGRAQEAAPSRAKQQQRMWTEGGKGGWAK